MQVQETWYFSCLPLSKQYVCSRNRKPGRSLEYLCPTGQSPEQPALVDPALSKVIALVDISSNHNRSEIVRNNINILNIKFKCI